jgi:hypothetical protein
VRRTLFLLAVALGVMTGQPSHGQPAPAAGKANPVVSFRRDVAPVLQTSCAMCHQNAGPMAGLSLEAAEAYGMLVNVQSSERPMMRVQPRQPAQSYLIRKLEGDHVAAGGKGLAMPIGQAPLTKQELEQVRLWITQGAPDN